MKTSAAFASGLWVGGMAVAIAGGIFFYVRGSAPDGNGDDVGLEVKMRVLQADYDRKESEVARLSDQLRVLQNSTRNRGGTVTPTKVPTSTSTPQADIVPAEPDPLPAPNEPEPPAEPSIGQADPFVVEDPASGISVTFNPESVELHAVDGVGREIWRTSLKSAPESMIIRNGQLQLTPGDPIQIDLATGDRLN